MTYVCISQITMTTGWLLLLLLLVVSSQSVDSQSTTDDEVCDGGQSCEMKRDAEMQTILDNQQQLFQQLESIRRGKLACFT